MARNTRYWWALYRNIESGYGYWYCIKTLNQNMYFLEFRRANQSTETALKLHWIDPKTAPATKSISRLQRLIACYIYIIYSIIYIPENSIVSKIIQNICCFRNFCFLEQTTINLFSSIFWCWWTFVPRNSMISWICMKSVTERGQVVLWQSNWFNMIWKDAIVDCIDSMIREYFSTQITNTALDEALGGHISSPTMVEIVKSP